MKTDGRYGRFMWLWYDWRAAAVADDEGTILDVEQWDGFYDERSVVQRLECIAAAGLTPEGMTVSYTHLRAHET